MTTLGFLAAADEQTIGTGLDDEDKIFSLDGLFVIMAATILSPTTLVFWKILGDLLGLKHDEAAANESAKFVKSERLMVSFFLPLKPFILETCGSSSCEAA